MARPSPLDGRPSSGAGSVCISEFSFKPRLQPGDQAASYEGSEPFQRFAFSLHCRKALETVETVRGSPGWHFLHRAESRGVNESDNSRRGRMKLTAPQ